MAAYHNIVILTGAGISAESGLRTFRAEDGLWEDHPVEQVATPEGFRRDPDLVQRFYDERRAQVLAAQPNAAHLALGRLEREWANGTGRELLIVTQNIDDLHERGGAGRVLHMHGEALSAWCTNCDARLPWTGTLRDTPACPACGQAQLRPDIVWFGEMPYRMGEIFAAEARRVGARTLELNLERSLGSRLFDETRLGPASELVPEWVTDLLAAS